MKDGNTSMNAIQKLYKHFTYNLTARKAMAVVLGNLILGFGCALLAYSLMGNEPYTAMNMAMSGGFGMGLGNYQLIVNFVLLIAQLIWGRKYIGFGSIINMFFLGYIIEFSGYAIQSMFGSSDGYGFGLCLIIMAVAFLFMTFGLSMYQIASVGVAPYDYVAWGLTDHFPTPFFANRMIGDFCCVLIIVLSVFGGLITWQTSHLGIGTIVGAFCLGPFINFFNKYNRVWIEGKGKKE